MLNNKSIALLGTLAISHLAHAALNDTGITTCSNETQNGLPCPVAGFPGQDAEYGTNSFDFTKLDANGNAMSVAATNHSCVQDNVTGLMWEVKTDDGGLRDKDNTYTFDQAATFAANVNATNLCGHNDWRVPSPHELASIVDYSVYNPSIDEDFFPYTSNSYYWTNDQYAADSSASWVVHFSYGYVYSNLRHYNYAVRLVRVGQWLLPLVFTDQGNGTVTEASTGLMWAKCSVGQGATDCSGSPSSLNWQQALQAADNSTLAGYTDWRLPNVKELQTLVDYTKYSPSINPSVFPNTPSSRYWSNSPYAADSSYSWIVHFSSGNVGSNNRNLNGAVRLVRVGQWLLPFALNVAKTGNGAGSVLSNPAGINCGSDCSENFAKDTAVTLTATPAAGSTFGGWSSNCANGQVNLTADTTCTAIFNVAPTAPVVSTNAPSLITSTSATLTGTVNPNGAATTVTFEFGLNTNYDVANLPAIPATIAATAGATNVSAITTGLTCHTNHHYRIRGTNSAGTATGNDQSFNTANCPAVNGVCGTANGATFFTAPTTNLCSTGTATTVTGTGPWNWSCAGSNGGSNASCTANIARYTVTPSAGTGGTVSPNTAQTVIHGTKKAFTVAANTGYIKNTSVGGNCPQGNWNGNVWTTGAIIANCSVNFSFTPPIVTSYTVTPSANPIAGGSFAPETAQTVNAGTTTSFTVIPSTNSGGYVTNPAVTGTCPLGSWGGTWNNVWTTGTINQHCTVIFGFTAVNAWIAPPNQTIIPDQPFTLDITVKSNSVKVGRYDFVVTFDTTKLRLDTTYTDATGLCVSGICPGTSALANRLPPIIDGNAITLTGYDSVGKGPSNDLQLLVMHFRSRYVADAPSFVTGVALKTNILTTAYGDNIGTGARGATVNVSTGLCGDADGNTSVNIVDALAIARKVVGMPPPPTVEDVLADVNEDGRVAITDALHVARYSVGLVRMPEVCIIGQAF